MKQYFALNQITPCSPIYKAGRSILLVLISITVLISSGCTPRLGAYLHNDEVVYKRPPIDQYFGLSVPYQPGIPAIAVERDHFMQAPKFTAADPIPLSPGDRLQITIQNGEPYSGLFEVDLDGNLKVPFLEPIKAFGQTTDDVERALADALVEKKLFYRKRLMLSVRVQQWAPIQVHVGGAVF